MTASDRKFTALCLPLTAAFLAAGVTVGAAADAVSTGASPRCLDAVRKAESDLSLGVQGGSDEQANERQEAKVHLYIAAIAADRGEEEQCWRQFHAALSALE